MRCRTAFSTAALSLLAGCASIRSTPTDAPRDGLVYYMPKKDIIVTVVKGTDANKAVTTSVTITASAAYPDMSQPYVLSFNRNLIGKNAMSVGVGSTGLLASSKSTTTSGVGDALKNLAESLGTIPAKGMFALVKPAAACGQGTHTFIYPAEPGPQEACGLTVTIERIAASKAAGAASAPSSDASTPPKPKEVSQSGIFYRQEEAYRVIVSGATQTTSQIVLSPSTASVRFLPIERTLFASNAADFAFVDGMPIKYDQNADGELIALLKLPADVIGAYFGAIGKTFDSFKANEDKQAEVLAASLKLELAKKKYEVCIKAIEAKNDQLIQQLECSK